MSRGDFRRPNRAEPADATLSLLSQRLFDGSLSISFPIKFLCEFMQQQNRSFFKNSCSDIYLISLGKWPFKRSWTTVIELVSANMTYGNYLGFAGLLGRMLLNKQNLSHRIE